MSKDTLISVDEHIFNLTNESEAIEGFEFKENVTIINPGEMIEHIDNDSILEFLNCPTTKVFIKKDDSGHATTKILAHNYIANETIEITNIGDHIIAMNEVLLQGIRKRRELKTNPDAIILTNEMIERINGMLFSSRVGEIGIGAYRDIDFCGRPCNVAVGSVDEHGVTHLVPEWQPIKGGNGRIPHLMNILVNWTNSKQFKQMDPILRAVKFHSMFIHIHPFRDGNGRTGRMILNYMLALSNLPLTSIRDADCEAYLYGVTQAIAYKNYQPLIDVVKNNQIHYSRELFASVVRYHKEHKRRLTMLGSQINGMDN